MELCKRFMKTSSDMLVSRHTVRGPRRLNITGCFNVASTPNDYQPFWKFITVDICSGKMVPFC